MKSIISLISIIAIASAFGQMPLPSIPDSLPIGKMQVLEKLADAKTVEVECFAPGMKTFRQVVSIPENFDSIEDISTAIETIQVTIAPTDPTADIVLHARIMDAVGDVQFEAQQGFKLEKVYVNEGVSYQVPSWVGDLYFWFANAGIYFPSAQAAFFVGDDSEFELTITNGVISLGNFGSGFLKIVTSSGIYYYDMNTGMKVTSPFEGFGTTAQFEDIQTVFDGYVYRTLYPEWNYSPWLEVTASENGVITFDVLSRNGYEPTGVWVRTLEQLRTGIESPPTKYTQGMILKVNPGQTIYVWFDFPEWVWGMGVYYGVGEKGI